MSRIHIESNGVGGFTVTKSNERHYGLDIHGAIKQAADLHGTVDLDRTATAALTGSESVPDSPRRYVDESPKGDLRTRYDKWQVLASSLHGALATPSLGNGPVTMSHSVAVRIALLPILPVRPAEARAGI